MAQRTTLPGPQGLARKPKRLDIRFFPVAAADPTYSDQDTKGVASIALSATGTWLITLEDTYKRLLSAQATIQMAAATDLVPQFGAVSNLATTTPVTVVLRANAVATPTDIAADANNSISVTLIFDDADT
jgi:hypothetical protein